MFSAGAGGFGALGKAAWERIEAVTGRMVKLVGADRIGIAIEVCPDAHVGDAAEFFGLRFHHEAVMVIFDFDLEQFGVFAFPIEEQEVGALRRLRLGERWQRKEQDNK